MDKTKVLKLIEKEKKERLKDAVFYHKRFLKSEMGVRLTIKNCEDEIKDIDPMDEFDNLFYTQGALEMLESLTNLIKKYG